MAAQVEPVYADDKAIVTIASGAQLSNGALLGNRRLLGLIIPADTEGTAVTFQASIDGTNYFVMYNADGAISYNFTDPGYLAVNPLDFLGVKYLKVDTGTNQTTAAAQITLVTG